jgi:hypothetical protein
MLLTFTRKNNKKSAQLTWAANSSISTDMENKLRAPLVALGDELTVLFDEHPQLPRGSALSAYGIYYCGWDRCPFDLADIVERLVRDRYADFEVLKQIPKHTYN